MHEYMQATKMIADKFLEDPAVEALVATKLVKVVIYIFSNKYLKYNGKVHYIYSTEYIFSIFCY